MEIQYQLMPYGIPGELLLTDMDGNRRKHFVDVWIERRRNYEKKFSKRSHHSDYNVCNYNDDTIVPTGKDVLLGRGVPIQTHAGNVKLSKLIDEAYDLYYNNNISRSHKTAMTWNILKRIQADGGRFLERNGDIGEWVVTSDEKARQKVSWGFRSHTKMIRKRIIKACKEKRPINKNGKRSTSS